KRGRKPEWPQIRVPEWALRTGRPAPVDANSFRGSAGGSPVRGLPIIPGQFLTAEDIADGRFNDRQRRGGPGPDPSHNRVGGGHLAKIAVVERQHAAGRIGVGFVTGTGLRRGAFASTIAHDAHNIVVVGADDRDMAACVARLHEIGGGIVVAQDGRATADLALPVAGLMSDRPPGAGAAALSRLESRLQEMGVSLTAPFMALSFLALSVIPKLKITDRGLIDVNRFEVVPVVV